VEPEGCEINTRHFQVEGGNEGSSGFFTAGRELRKEPPGKRGAMKELYEKGRGAVLLWSILFYGTDLLRRRFGGWCGTSWAMGEKLENEGGVCRCRIC